MNNEKINEINHIIEQSLATLDDAKFLIENKINKEYGKFVHKIFDLRTKADYDFYFHFEENEVKQMYDEVKVFINDIIKLIKEN